MNTQSSTNTEGQVLTNSVAGIGLRPAGIVRGELGCWERRMGDGHALLMAEGAKDSTACWRTDGAIAGEGKVERALVEAEAWEREPDTHEPHRYSASASS